MLLIVKPDDLIHNDATSPDSDHFDNPCQKGPLKQLFLSPLSQHVFKLPVTKQRLEIKINHALFDVLVNFLVWTLLSIYMTHVFNQHASMIKGSFLSAHPQPLTLYIFRCRRNQLLDPNTQGIPILWMGWKLNGWLDEILSCWLSQDDAFDQHQ